LFALLAETGFCEIKISSSGLNPHDLLRALRIWNTSGSMLAEDNWGRVEFGYSLGELSQRRGFSSTRKIIEALLRMTGSGDTLTFVAERFD
jgi:hypothetical protein